MATTKKKNPANRSDGRKIDQLRPLTFECNFAQGATGSVLIHMGHTRVLCGVTIEEKVPPWMRANKVSGGWITAEYSMLPYAGGGRSRREASAGKVSGRTQEIQRLIGRSMRAIVDLEQLGPRTIWIDCDVIQADGGTRTASITGAYVALKLALKKLKQDGTLTTNPLKDSVAAISVGVVDGKALLDLCYVEDVAAEVDMNVVMTGAGKYVEVQGTAEGDPFSQAELTRLLSLAKKGIGELTKAQAKALRSGK